jgi:uncharacterized membrane protein YbaN (DUF454 family)
VNLIFLIFFQKLSKRIYKMIYELFLFLQMIHRFEKDFLSSYINYFEAK